jgi:hypothetical protein
MTVTLEELASDWCEPPEKIAAQVSEVLYHSYTYEDYTGDAFTLFRDKDGRLMEANGGHCSCYGLEDQWEPEETFKEALLKRGHLDKELRKLVEALPDTLSN